jgi:hypothetical protein
LLLYNQEREQYEHFRIQQAERTIKQEIEWVWYLLFYISCVNLCVCVCVPFFLLSDMPANSQLVCATTVTKSHTSASALCVSFSFFIRVLADLFLGEKVMHITVS